MKLLLTFITLIGLIACNTGVSKQPGVVDLRDSGITSLSDSIWALTDTKELYIGSKELIHYPPSAWMPKTISEITVLPESIDKLVNLQKLVITGTKITDLPQSIKNLSNLKVIDISYNSFLKMHETWDLISRIPTLDTVKAYRVDFSRESLNIIYSMNPKLTVVNMDYHMRNPSTKFGEL